jgi:branched-chain amino acid transport system ATP-binding protein
VLEAANVTRAFGGLTAIDDVSLTVGEGETVGLIGPNGAGKSTFINLVTGSLALDAGSVLIDGEDSTRWPPERIARSGVGRTFQRCRIFRDLTVAHNLDVALDQARDARPGSAGSRAFRRDRDEARALMARFELTDVQGLVAGTLAFGTQRRLELARALATRPRYMMLDEPFSGMQATEIARLLPLLRDVTEEGVGVLLVEHHTEVVFGICSRVVVLESGRLIAHGAPEEIRRSPAVAAAYLGTRHAEVGG